MGTDKWDETRPWRSALRVLVSERNLILGAVVLGILLFSVLLMFRGCSVLRLRADVDSPPRDPWEAVDETGFPRDDGDWGKGVGGNLSGERAQPGGAPHPPGSNEELGYEMPVELESGH